MIMKYHNQTNITALASNQIFVFGSNTEGIHGAGAAKQALSFGAQYGNPKGIQGQSYAIITKDLSKGNRSISLSYIENQIKEMYSFARKHKNKQFLATPIGCGLGGFYLSEIAPLFLRNNPPDNVLLPISFKTLETFK